jgi:hypothetical protein
MVSCAHIAMPKARNAAIEQAAVARAARACSAGDAITSVAFSPAGTILATGDITANTDLWRIPSL